MWGRDLNTENTMKAFITFSVSHSGHLGSKIMNEGAYFILIYLGFCPDLKLKVPCPSKSFSCRIPGVAVTLSGPSMWDDGDEMTVRVVSGEIGRLSFSLYLISEPVEIKSSVDIQQKIPNFYPYSAENVDYDTIPSIHVSPAPCFLGPDSSF